jgi:hypothetical protein
MCDSIILFAQNIAPKFMERRTDPWTWKLRVDNPKNPGQALLELMRQWCSANVGERGTEWNNAGVRFYFAYRDDAMLFKLTWHGTAP